MTIRIPSVLGVMLVPRPKTLSKNLMTSLLLSVGGLLLKTPLTLQAPPRRIRTIQITKTQMTRTQTRTQLQTQETTLSAFPHRPCSLTMTLTRLILLVRTPNMCLKHSTFVLDSDDLEDRADIYAGGHHIEFGFR